MKETTVILFLLFKRFIMRKRFIFSLVFVCFLLIWIEGIGKEDELYVKAGVYLEEQTRWNENLAHNLESVEGDIVFQIYTNYDEFLQDIVVGNVECGYILQEDLQKRMKGKLWDSSIKVYESSRSMLTSTINEVFFKELYELVSREWFEGYVANLKEFEDIPPQFLKERINESYEKHVLEKNTFHIEHFYVDRKTNFEEKENLNKSIQIFPLRGVISVLIFLAGILGLFDYFKDSKSGVFSMKRKNGLVFFMDLLIPIMTMNICVLSILLILGKWEGKVEILSLLVYSIVVVVSCIIFYFIFRNEKILMATLPILVLLSLVFAPIFWNIGSMIPELKGVEKYIPMTYYCTFFN